MYVFQTEQKNTLADSLISKMSKDTLFYGVVWKKNLRDINPLTSCVANVETTGWTIGMDELIEKSALDRYANIYQKIPYNGGFLRYKDIASDIERLATDPEFNDCYTYYDDWGHEILNLFDDDGVKNFKLNRRPNSYVFRRVTDGLIFISLSAKEKKDGLWGAKFTVTHWISLNCCMQFDDILKRKLGLPTSGNTITRPGNSTGSGTTATGGASSPCPCDCKEVNNPVTLYLTKNPSGSKAVPVNVKIKKRICNTNANNNKSQISYPCDKTAEINKRLTEIYNV